MMIHKTWKSAGARNIERYFERKRIKIDFLAKHKKMQNVGCQDIII